MTDKQFEALLGAISQLTLAVRDQSAIQREFLFDIATHILVLNETLQDPDGLNPEESDGLEDLDTPIGGDGE